MRRAVILLAFLATGCTAISNPLTGESSRPPGTFTVNIPPQGCGAIVDSNTLKGGPTVIIQKTLEGDCTVEVRHNPSIAELQPLLNILGGI